LLLAPESCDDEPATLEGTPALAISVSDTLASKEQFPHLRNGRPWSQKDIADIEILRTLASEERTETTSEGPAITYIR
jgi:hypothetical protein